MNEASRRVRFRHFATEVLFSVGLPSLFEIETGPRLLLWCSPLVLEWPYSHLISLNRRGSAKPPVVNLSQQIREEGRVPRPDPPDLLPAVKVRIEQVKVLVIMMVVILRFRVRVNGRVVESVRAIEAANVGPAVSKNVILVGPETDDTVLPGLMGMESPDGEVLPDIEHYVFPAANPTGEDDIPVVRLRDEGEIMVEDYAVTLLLKNSHAAFRVLFESTGGNWVIHALYFRS